MNKANNALHKLYWWSADWAAALYNQAHYTYSESDYPLAQSVSFPLEMWLARIKGIRKELRKKFQEERAQWKVSLATACAERNQARNSLFQFRTEYEDAKKQNQLSRLTFLQSFCDDWLDIYVVRRARVKHRRDAEPKWLYEDARFLVREGKLYLQMVGERNGYSWSLGRTNIRNNFCSALFDLHQFEELLSSLAHSYVHETAPSLDFPTNADKPLRISAVVHEGSKAFYVAPISDGEQLALSNYLETKQ